MNSVYAPIILFAFNRPIHTQKTIDALKMNLESAESELFVFIDGSRGERDLNAVSKVKDIAYNISGFKKVYISEATSNRGLASSIIGGVSKVIKEKGRAIILEDDMVVSPYFLQFMNDALRVYENEEKIISINAYLPPVSVQNLKEDVFCLKGADCWGWATWSRGWELFNSDGKFLINEIKKLKLVDEFNFAGTYPYVQMLQDQIDGKNNSWAIRWQASAFVHNKFSIYPKESLLLNIGHDGSGSHSGTTSLYEVPLAKRPLQVNPIEVIENNHEMLIEFQKYYSKIAPSFLDRLKSKIKKLSKKLFMKIG